MHLQIVTMECHMKMKLYGMSELRCMRCCCCTVVMSWRVAIRSGGEILKSGFCSWGSPLTTNISNKVWLENLFYLQNSHNQPLLLLFLSFLIPFLLFRLLWRTSFVSSLLTHFSSSTGWKEFKVSSSSSHPFQAIRWGKAQEGRRPFIIPNCCSIRYKFLSALWPLHYVMTSGCGGGLIALDSS